MNSFYHRKTLLETSDAERDAKANALHSRRFTVRRLVWTGRVTCVRSPESEPGLGQESVCPATDKSASLHLPSLGDSLMIKRQLGNATRAFRHQEETQCSCILGCRLVPSETVEKYLCSWALGFVTKPRCPGPSTARGMLSTDSPSRSLIYFLSSTFSSQSE